MGTKLNGRQKALMRFILDYMTENAGNSPTIRGILKAEVGKGTYNGAFTSTSVINYNLNRLVDHGLIERAPGIARHIRIPGSSWTYPEGLDGLF